MELISDIRTVDQFRTTTFSKYQRSAVKKEMLQSLIQSKIEPSMYWLIELLCSGHVSDIWEIILFFYAKHIHVSNPKLPFYIESRFNHFKQCIQDSNELNIRNNEIVRKLFSEIITILCLSNKHHSYEIIKFNKSDFNILTTDRLKAPSVEFIGTIFKPEDPKALFNYTLKIHLMPVTGLNGFLNIQVKRNVLHLFVNYVPNILQILFGLFGNYYFILQPNYTT